MRVAESVLKIVSARGLVGISHSTVSRASGVSRPWLYAYVGKTKNSLVELAAKSLGEIYAGVSRNPDVRDADSWLDLQIEDIQEGFQMGRQYPWLIPLYFRFRETQNPLGEVIDMVQKTYVDRQIQFAMKAFNIDKELARFVVDASTAFKLNLEYQASFSPHTAQAEKQIVDRARRWLKGAVINLMKEKVGGG